MGIFLLGGGIFHPKAAHEFSKLASVKNSSGFLYPNGCLGTQKGSLLTRAPKRILWRHRYGTEDSVQLSFTQGKSNRGEGTVWWVSIGDSIMCSAAVACSSICQVEGKAEIKGTVLGWYGLESAWKRPTMVDSRDQVMICIDVIYAESDSGFFFFLSFS